MAISSITQQLSVTQKILCKRGKNTYLLVKKSKSRERSYSRKIGTYFIKIEEVVHSLKIFENVAGYIMITNE